MTSDNVSPIHLMDIKRIAFETKPVNKMVTAIPGTQRSAAVVGNKPPVKREQIAAIVDRFLSEKVKDFPPTPIDKEPIEAAPEVSPVRTVIHELRPQSLTENGVSNSPMDFVSETDVRVAIEKGQKIYINAKSIITPSARDLGEEKDVFARV